MNIEFFPLRYFLLGVDFTLDIPHQELIQEFKKEDWVCWNADVPKGHENPNWNYRYKLPEIKTPTVQKIRDYLQSDQVYNAALDGLYNFGNPFTGLWSMPKEQMKDWACWHVEFMWDKPGFYLEPHNDYRRLVAAGMIYFTEHDDVNVSTTFYSDRQLSHPMTMTTNYGDGWLAVNDYCNWHEGRNASDYDRYSVLLGLTIKTPKDYQ
jgi:hypothetical protein